MEELDTDTVNDDQLYNLLLVIGSCATDELDLRILLESLGIPLDRSKDVYWSRRHPAS